MKDNRDKTEEMSELVDLIILSAEAQGYWNALKGIDRATIDFWKKRTQELKAKLLSSLPPSGPRIEQRWAENGDMSWCILDGKRIIAFGEPNSKTDCEEVISRGDELTPYADCPEYSLTSPPVPPSGVASEATVNQEMLAALKACHLQMLQSNNDSEYAEEANQLAIAAIKRAEALHED